MIIDIKTGKKLTERTDEHGRPITNPDVLAEIDRIESMGKRIPVNLQIRLKNLKRDGDQAKNRNKIKRVSPAAPNSETLQDLNNQTPTNSIREALKAVKNIINDVYNGESPIAAIKKSCLSPRVFYNLLDGKPTPSLKKSIRIEQALIKNKNAQFPDTHSNLHSNSVLNDNPQDPDYSDDNEVCKIYDTLNELKSEFVRARCIFAEFCLYKREMLENQLLNGEIDSATYATLANDYKYLAAKFAPSMYGDKISIESTITQKTTSMPSMDKVQELNALINNNLLTDESIKEAEYTEVDK